MVDMDKRHMQEIQQRDLQVAEMRGTLTAHNTRGSRVGPGRSELLDPKILQKGATLRRTTDVVENLRVPMESLPHRSGQKVQRALGQNRRSHRTRTQRRFAP